MGITGTGWSLPAREAVPWRVRRDQADVTRVAERRDVSLTMGGVPLGDHVGLAAFHDALPADPDGPVDDRLGVDDDRAARPDARVQRGVTGGIAQDPGRIGPRGDVR